jgi:hypothetical protein
VNLKNFQAAPPDGRNCLFPPRPRRAGAVALVQGMVNAGIVVLISRVTPAFAPLTFALGALALFGAVSVNLLAGCCGLVLSKGGGAGAQPPPCTRQTSGITSVCESDLDLEGAVQ